MSRARPRRSGTRTTRQPSGSSNVNASTPSHHGFSAVTGSLPSERRRSAARSRAAASSEVEHEQVLGARRATGAAVGVAGELELELTPRQAQDRAAVAVVVLEAADPLEAQALRVEPDDLLQPVGRPGHPDRRGGAGYVQHGPRVLPRRLSRHEQLSRLMGKTQREETDMKVLVAGATGALGKQLVPRLVGRRPRGGRHDPQRRPSATPCCALGATPVVADALDPDAVARAVAEAEPEVIVHQLTALSGSLDLRHFERDFALDQPAAHRGHRPPAGRRPRGRRAAGSWPRATPAGRSPAAAAR